MKKLGLLSIFLAVFSVGALRADFVPYEANQNLLPRSEFAYSSGWRWDHAEENEKDFTLGEPDGGANIKYKSIPVWEFGIRGTLAIPSCYTECGWDWLSQFYATGYAYWGTVADSGSRKLRAFEQDGTTLSTSTRKVRAGQSHNYQIGAGWLWPVTCEFGIAPTAGYGWDDLTIRPSSLVRTSNEITSTTAFAIDQHSRKFFRGPYLGVELVYDINFCGCNNIRLNAGYEYHWLKSKYTLVNNSLSVDLENCIARTFTVHKNNARGQVGYLYGTWDFCDCWALRVGGKYRNFHAGYGFAKPSPALNEVDCGTARFNNRWRSWEVTFDLAYRF